MANWDLAALRFKVGDWVTLVKRGDADGCSGGPPLHAIGRIVVVREISTCGPYRIEWAGYGGWWTSDDHVQYCDDPNGPNFRESQ